MNSLNEKINPLWVTGLIDSIGNFDVTFTENNNNSTGWSVQPSFKLEYNKKNLELLLGIKSFFNDVGSIIPNSNGLTFVYEVTLLNDLTEIIIPHLTAYPLISIKQTDFFLFKNIIELMNNGEHLKSLINIVNLTASINLEYFNKLKVHFSELVLIKKPPRITPSNLDYNWLAGFYTNKAFYDINIATPFRRSNVYSNLHKEAYPIVRLRVFIAQNLKSKDILLLKSIMNTLGTGTICEHKKDITVFSINNFIDLYTKIIPLFKKYGIKGAVHKDFEKFCLAADLVHKKAHLSKSGLNEIRCIIRDLN